MKSILFCLPTMTLGGVERSLISILSLFDRNEFTLSILLFYTYDEEIERQIPSGIKIFNLNLDKEYYSTATKVLIVKRLKMMHFGEVISLGIKKVLGIGLPGANITFKDIPELNEQFDYAVCYHAHSAIMLNYTANCVSAKTKILWVHNDFSTTGYRIDLLSKHVKKYDIICFVSEKLKNEFLELYPNSRDKTKTVYNIIDAKDIIDKANMSMSDGNFYYSKGPKLLTIGRFVEDKGFDIAIKACAELVREYTTLRWYAIGYGEKESDMRNLIRELRIENNFIILGKKSNPYPYLKDCDIYVQPSRHEGYCLAVAEARILCKPIICTDFAGASEQIINGVNGVITAFDIKAIVDAVCQFVESPHKQKLFSNTLEKQRNTVIDFKHIHDVFD